MDATPPARKTPAETPCLILRAEDVAFWCVVERGASKARRHAWVRDAKGKGQAFRAVCGRAPGHRPALERYRSSRPGHNVCRHCQRRVWTYPEAGPTGAWTVSLAPPAHDGASTPAPA